MFIVVIIGYFPYVLGPYDVHQNVSVCVVDIMAFYTNYLLTPSLDPTFMNVAKTSFILHSTSLVFSIYEAIALLLYPPKIVSKYLTNQLQLCIVINFQCLIKIHFRK
ncbi:hypothetical protein VIGAN_06148400, partial [Vigna angularis var. angularis]